MRLQFSILCWLFVLVNILPAQGWQGVYGAPWDDRSFALQVLPDGALLAVGSAMPDSAANTNWSFLLTDALGNMVAQNQWGDQDWSESANILLPKPGAGWLVGGTRYQEHPLFFSVGSATFTFVDNAGQPADPVVLGDISSLSEGILLDDGFLLVGAEYFPFGIDGIAPQPFYNKIDTSGAVVWSEHAFFGQYGALNAAVALPDGGALLGGSYLDTVPTPGLFDLFVLKIDAAGQPKDSLFLQLPEQQRFDKLLAHPDGDFILVGRTNVNSTDPDILLAAINTDLDTLWTQTISMPGLHQAHAALALSDGRILLAGETRTNGSASRDAFMACTDALGNLLWSKTYGGIKGDIFWDVQRAPDGGFALAGQTASFDDLSLQAWLVRTDTLGNLWSSIVNGRVVRDTITDCIAQADEVGLAGWLVTAAGAPGVVYAITDTLGNYNIPLDTGIWYLSVLPPSGYWTPCADSMQVFFNQINQTDTLDIPVQASYDCPLLYIDITSPYLRRCFDNIYAVRYFNYGTVSATSATAMVVLDPFLSPTGATLPYTQSGDTLRFELGDVAALSGGTFSLSALLDCDSTVLGQVHCTSAYVTPDSLCYDLAPEWDGSNLVVSGYCVGDSVVLTISNTGIGNMGEAVEFVITEDQIIFKREPILLAAGQDSTFVLYANGATVTLTLSQTKGHPTGSMPTIVIEGCGGLPFSTGYALQFPTDDGDPFSDTECRENIGSYDPNDKTGLPRGVGNENMIAAGTAMEYLIRFQNTGTDTAFRVEIRDTLPVGFDLATLERGAASHAYQLDVTGSGVLRFVFDPIALPDSSTNTLNSQGFVKFRISTQTDIPAGTQLENQAAIYFDFNAAVFTDYTLHTIGDPFDWFLVSVPETPGTKPALPKILAAPNPFRKFTRLSWPVGDIGKPYSLEVTDLLGRVCLRQETRNTEYQLNAACLASGTYLIRVWQGGNLVALGRIITLKP